ETFKEAAIKIMKEDVKDAPYVACYLALKCDCVWTNDTDYEGKEEVKVFSTEKLLGLIEDGQYRKNNLEKEKEQ
ncbi:MAG: PIN domain-containing protein, partial [Nanoarchaeota archaeon]